VDSIESPLTSPFDYDGIYSQAYTLYQQGFQYWFDKPEIERLQRHNEVYTTPNDEEELVAEYFRVPHGTETGEFMRTAIAKQLLSSPGMNISTIALGRAFKRLGFKAGTIDRNRGYYVVRILPEERKQRAVSLAYDAMKSEQKRTKNDTDNTDVTDVF
jgi:predicted P-loop ATPase